MPIDSSIRNIIKAEGYITIDDMMRQVLSTNSSSYYRSTENIGIKGDFITAPEISQLFGETIGVWLTIQWHKMGCPKEIAILELGPGQGILMRDLLRVAKVTTDLFAAIRIYLHDINPFFIEKQRSSLQPFDKEINWIAKISDLPKIPTIFIANEFFDAIPIKQFIKIKDLWYEVILKINPVDSRIKADKIRVHKELQKQLFFDHPNAHDGAVIEESIESIEMVRFIANHLKENKGCGIIIDYGYDIELTKRSRTQYNSTLQAIKNHQYAAIIDTIGEADLSAHVDFQAFKKSLAEQKIPNSSIVSQAEFLKNYGIIDRLKILKKKSPEFEEVLEKQAQRLLNAKQMGTLFKVLEFNNEICDH
jgi:SAM-dependent MidA family methyltransferase